MIQAALSPRSLLALRPPSALPVILPPASPATLDQGAIVGSAETSRTDASKFAIGFDHRDRARLFELWAEVLDSEQWSEGRCWTPSSSAGRSGTGCRASASRAGPVARWRRSSSPASGARRCSAPRTPSWRRRWRRSSAGAEVEFVDCNRDDLCMSFEDFEAKAERHKPKAAILVHIGGHIAFESERIAAYCREQRDLPARGLRPRPRRRVERPQARRLRRRRRLLALRDQDGLDRRGRRARLRQRRADRVRRASSATTASSSTRSTGSTSA